MSLLNFTMAFNEHVSDPAMTCYDPGTAMTNARGKNIVLIKVALAVFNVPTSIFVCAPSIVFCLCLCMLLCFLPLKIKKKEQKSKSPPSNILPMNFTFLKLGLSGHILYELSR